MKLFQKSILVLLVVALANPVQVSAGWKSKAAFGLTFVGAVAMGWFYLSNKKRNPQCNVKLTNGEMASTVSEDSIVTRDTDVVEAQVLVSQAEAIVPAQTGVPVKNRKAVKKGIQAQVDFFQDIINKNPNKLAGT